MSALDGKVALVTGAASGLGLETARLFVEEGARVVASDVGKEPSEALRDLGSELLYVRADVRSRADVDAAVEAAEASFGRLDCVVANAGIMGSASFRPIEEVTDEDWATVLDVNLTGTFRTFRAAVPALRRAGGGAMSATSSLSGVFATVYRSAYGASKGGIDALVRGLAVELAPGQDPRQLDRPGAMRTNISRASSEDDADIHVPMPDRSRQGQDARPGPRWHEGGGAGSPVPLLRSRGLRQR